VIGAHFVLNGELRPTAEALVAIDDINFAYGFGVYETLKLRKGVVFFPDRHADRLLHSAEIIELAHPFSREDIERSVLDLARKNGIRDANIKMLLIGSPDIEAAEGAHLYVFMLNPLFPRRELYRDGAFAVCFDGERRYPQAKSLDMLTSTLAYRRARGAGAYDALLVNREREITEGTRTNLFYTDGETVYQPPKSDALLGVTKLTLEEVLGQRGVAVLERPLLRSEVGTWKGYFLTSTSSKVIPVSRIDHHHFEIPEIVRDIMGAYDAFLDDYRRAQTPIVAEY
jgi:branched-subunit amino acid aminotransferase/4-amino-4-deoxychorismate lyase